MTNVRQIYAQHAGNNPNERMANVRTNEQRGSEAMRTTRQPSAHPRWDAFTNSFKQSNYITDFWNWFMTLISKAAEMVLFGTVLYAGYQLLPGVPHVPAPIDAAVFVIQQGALDIGGMGLLKLAKRAGLPRDAFPVRLGMSYALREEYGESTITVHEANELQ